jgi:hypothetical protein
MVAFGRGPGGPRAARRSALENGWPRSRGRRHRPAALRRSPAAPVLKDRLQPRVRPLLILTRVTNIDVSNMNVSILHGTIMILLACPFRSSLARRSMLVVGLRRDPGRSFGSTGLDPAGGERSWPLFSDVSTYTGSRSGPGAGGLRPVPPPPRGTGVRHGVGMRRPLARVPLSSPVTDAPFRP